MRVLLISANKEEINMVTLPLGLGVVAAATMKAGHELELLDLLRISNVRSAIKKVIEGLRPEVIGVSVRNIDNQIMAQPKFLLDQAKETVAICRDYSDAPIVVGGAGYSLFPERALSYLDADMGIQGEGELAFPMLLEYMEQNADLSDVPGLFLPGLGLQSRRKFDKNLDQFPPPTTFLAPISVPDDTALWMPLQTSRGCPLNCSYCSTATIEGRFIRRRSPRNVVRDIALFLDKGCDHFFFIDSIFNLPPSHARDICLNIIESGLVITWRCILYPCRIDEDLIDLMARAGCKEVSLGFESGCERILKCFNKRFKPDDVRHTNDILAKHGIKRMGFLLLGAPGETRETVEESLAFAHSLDLDTLKITTGIRIYPNTSLARTAALEGMISPDDDLLFPKFYIPDDLKEWVGITLKKWMDERPHWIY